MYPFAQAIGVLVQAVLHIGFCVTVARKGPIQVLQVASGVPGVQFGPVELVVCGLAFPGDEPVGVLALRSVMDGLKMRQAHQPDIDPVVLQEALAVILDSLRYDA